MSQFILAPAAKSDIFEILNYYAWEVGDAELADRMRRFFAGFALPLENRVLATSAVTSRMSRCVSGECGSI